MNLAAARCGAIVFASSFKDLKTRYPDNLLDDDSARIWQALDASFPQWIEIRWPHPVRISSVQLEAAPPSRIHHLSVRGMSAGTWHSLAESKTATASPGVAFVEKELERLRLELLAGEGGPVARSASRV